MATHTLADASVGAVPRPALHLAGKICIVALGLLGLGAIAGGIALMAKPDGSVMQFDVALLSGSPFADFMIPGLILGLLFGVGSFVVAAMGLARWPIAPFLAFAIGCAQMIWIVVELAIIQKLSFLHPMCFAIGLVIAASAVVWGWPTFHGWRESVRTA